MINAQIVAHSKDPRGNELVSVLATFPRIILAEVNTHRMLSKNTSSSRAIPFNKMVESVLTNPFIPIAWQTHHKGMQGTEYLTAPIDVAFANDVWLEARDRAVKSAKALYDGTKVTKQLANRLLEPFMWTTMLITGNLKDGGWDNFFRLRSPIYRQFGTTAKSKKEALKIFNHKEGLEQLSNLDWFQANEGQAEIHIMALAECIYDAINESTPNQLEEGEWHIPFTGEIDLFKVAKEYPDADSFQEVCVKISTAMAARTSYTVVGDEKEVDYNKMIELHNRLIAQNPPHSSPMEHCAKVMTNEEYHQYFKGELTTIEISDDSHLVESYLDDDKGAGWCRNFKGFIPYRHIIEIE